MFGVYKFRLCVLGLHHPTGVPIVEVPGLQDVAGLAWRCGGGASEGSSSTRLHYKGLQDLKVLRVSSFRP